MHILKIIKCINTQDLYLTDLECKVKHFAIYTEHLKKDSLYFHWHVKEQDDYLVKKALARNAFVVTSDKRFLKLKHPRIILTSSVRLALENLALYKRKYFQGKVIAITGSVGKSSVKNILASVLEMDHRIVYTLGNENAWLGIYCTLCNIQNETAFVILETGASGPNSLAKPIKVVRPNISVLLDVNFSHQEKYPNFQSLLHEKASIIDVLTEHDSLIISAHTYQKLLDIDYKGIIQNQVYKVGQREDSTVYIKEMKINPKESEVQLYIDGVCSILKIKQSNYANLMNACYAFAVLKLLGFTEQKFNALIPFYKPLPRRYERLRICTHFGKIIELIDDAYNASPSSSLSLLSSLEMRYVKRKILVFGDMLELGQKSMELHQQVFQTGNFDQFAYVVLLGEFSHFAELNVPMYKAANIEDAYLFLQNFIESGDLIILKASNKMKLFELRKRLESNAINIASLDSWYIEDEILA